MKFEDFKPGIICRHKNGEIFHLVSIEAIEIPVYHKALTKIKENRYVLTFLYQHGIVKLTPHLSITIDRWAQDYSIL